MTNFPSYFVAAVAALILLLVVGTIQVLIRFRRMSRRDRNIHEKLRRRL